MCCTENEHPDNNHKCFPMQKNRNNFLKKESTMCVGLGKPFEHSPYLFFTVHRGKQELLIVAPGLLMAIDINNNMVDALLAKSLQSRLSKCECERGKTFCTKTNQRWFVNVSVMTEIYGRAFESYWIHSGVASPEPRQIYPHLFTTLSLLKEFCKEWCYKVSQQRTNAFRANIRSLFNPFYVCATYFEAFYIGNFLM